jgi:hypothetical protein
MRKAALALFLLLSFGWVKLPTEQHLTQAHQAAYFHTTPLNLDLRQNLSQMGFLAALSGFRAVVADLLWIQAHTAWENTDWGRMKLLFDTVTTLQPRAIVFWEGAAWHMAWNASVAALENRSEPRLALRVKAQREFIRIGEDFLLRGISNNPDRHELYNRIGLLYKDKLGDHARAAAAYQKCAAIPGAPSYARRFALYELSQVPGQESQAYLGLKALYDESSSHWLPTLLTRLREMERKLNVPPDKRIRIPEGR